MLAEMFDYFGWGIWETLLSI